MSSKQYNVGVIGYGVKTGDDDASENHPSVKTYNSANLMFANPEIDIIVVTTPPETHFTFTKAALRAGKQVIVEKPFVPTSAKASDLIATAKDAGKLICVYQNRRWDSDFITVKKLITEGTLGRIVEYETHFDRYQENKPLG
ncbi:hypothetical protein BOTNAR_0006g00210 [Botryotinia narcissicola]|uniref:Gfo/Idh/MocA-like oxidoreductase N-terminal domain-containing protein n=1 Tax=Botryotinia narcissicola TaxID=278944 RepID=A0A4Z1J9F5_9HELO|nr:hypothetical protein BOTNAR_0006g00210 [Botryotinia narcissicola]